jgi:multicomponent Na+:H+ antiporter subunit B
MEALYERWQAATLEKVLVLVFVAISVLHLIGIELPHGQMGTLLSGGRIPVLNILVAVKVALGAWAVVVVFIRYRGLL